MSDSFLTCIGSFLSTSIWFIFNCKSERSVITVSRISVGFVLTVKALIESVNWSVLTEEDAAGG
jgi:hypothetical protein